MLKDKAMIIIAVSKYAGTYPELPGAITSARRLRKWAEQPDEDCNYKVLYLADDVFEKIDVQLVCEKVSEFVNNNFIDRLVVYFAGHGIVRSAGDQFWLLTDAAKNKREGINIEAFRRGLLKCNIGDADFAGQLCIIGDACRNTGRDATEFYGDPILTSTANMNRRSIQLDRFLSTGLGDYSFQINQTGSQSAYCLFSEVMLSALSGEVKEAIDTEDHRFKPVVTNHKLAAYLEKEVRSRAAAIEEDMEPDLFTGIHPPHNFYKRLDDTCQSVAVGSQYPQVPAVQRAFHSSQEKRIDEHIDSIQEQRKQTLLEGKRNVAELINYHLNYNPQLERNSHHSPIICDFLPSCIAASHEAQISVRSVGIFYEITETRTDGLPILIQQGEQWILVPTYPRIVNVLFGDLPGDILFYKPTTQTWDTYLSDFSSLIRSVPLRAAEARKFLDQTRGGKDEFPHQSVTAGYLYEFSNDYDNITRTAHYMNYYKGIVPFDLALLCADRIRWQKEKYGFAAYADLPAVERSESFEYEAIHPYYNKSEFQACENVRLWGIAPIFFQGWSFMQTEQYLEIPESIRLIGEKTSGRSATSLTNEGLEMFLKAFDYQVIKTDI